MAGIPTVTRSSIRELDLGPELPTGIGEEVSDLENKASGAVVRGSLVAFAPGVSELHQRDVLQSLLFAQLAANTKAQRHTEPLAWFRAYSRVMQRTAWVVEASSRVTRYHPQVLRFSVATVVNDVFRPKLLPEELAYVMATVNAFRSDLGGASQIVFECASHSGGIGNFQVAFAVEEDGVLSLHIVQVSFNAPQHVTRLMLEEFTSTAEFRVAFHALIQNEGIYASVRSIIADKVKAHLPGSVALLQLP